MEDPCSYCLLCCLLPLLLLVQLPAWAATEEFQVLGPPEPIVAVLGGDATLPCSVSPAMSVENMELRWFRTAFSDSVFVYRNQREQKEEQMAEYAGRTSLAMDVLAHGEAVLNIHAVRASDNGMYNCFFKMGSFFEEANLELKVAGVGSAPQVYIEGPEEDGVRLVCTASGWFPKPQVQWREVSGKKILAFSEAHTQDVEKLFRVEATVVVRDRSVGNVTCSILNPILGQERAVAIFIPEPFFPQASPWKPAFAVSLMVMGLLLFGAGYFLYREHSAKLRVQQEEKNQRSAKEADKETKEQALMAINKLQTHLGQRKAAYLAAWRKAQLYADWRKEVFEALSLTLDPGSAHPSIVISPEKTSLTWKDSGGSWSDTYSVLGFEGITSGRYYWEVEIVNGDHSEWTVGVCRENVERTGWYKEYLDKGFWVVGWSKNGYFTYTKPDTVFPSKQDCCRVGVFLDYHEGDVSFYDMTDGSHIFSFSPASFSGTLFPYFSFTRGSVSLTICSPRDGPLGPPAPLNNCPSLEETLRPSGEGLSSGPEVGDVTPGAESPLLSSGPEAGIP